MPDSKITALTNLTAADAINDMFPIVDVSDNLITASGTTKRISVNNLLSSSPTASGAFTVTGLVTAGSATITGDLTVDTSTLKVDSANNRVGIGTATPGAGYVLDVVGAARITAANGLVIDKAGAGLVDFLNSGNSGANVGTSGNGGLVIYTANGIGGAYGVRYVIDSTGISTWSVAGTTAMTLNSTGLGVGIVPSSFGRFSVQGTAGGAGILGMNTDATQCDIQSYNKPLALNRAGNNITMCEGGGNVGIGVTPSYKLHVAGANPTAAINSTTASISSIATLLYRNVDGNSATQSVASIAGETAGNGGYGNLIFSTGFNGSLVERMRIDLSGNLILQSSATPATLGTNGMLTVNATSNTNLRFSYRGSDGTTRIANITLA